MKKRHFKLGMVILSGLASYFLLLSVALVASADMPELSHSGGKTGQQLRKPLKAKHTANSGSNDKSRPRRGSGSFMSGQANPCLSMPATCDGAQPEDSLATGSWQSVGDSIVANSGSFGGRNSPFPTVYGFSSFSMGDATSGQIAGVGATGDSTQNGEGSSGSGPGATSFTFGESGPTDSSSPNDPTAVSPFLLTDTPHSGDPTGPSSSDPPSSEPPDIFSVPEPSTFWLIVASLTTVAGMLRYFGQSLRRSRRDHKV
jgi:hypothetical protein